ncbi:MAG: hypothetical protein IPK82_27095 [Polyangiaceae bacterium]|nr:hypothetical protein [Polyangiaceae bacterium]
MNLPEAYQELGIDPASSAEEARRAYLRQLKIKKPEADPNGFMRLREAYDRVRESIELRATLHKLGAFDVPSAAPPEPAVAPATQAVVKPDDEPEDAQLPDGWKVIELPAADSPVVIPRDETIRTLMSKNKFQAAAKELGAQIEEATEHGGVPVLPAGDIINLLCELHIREAPNAAAKLYGTVQDWFVASKEETRFLRGELAAKWVILAELNALPPTFSRSARSAIALALQGDNLQDANLNLAELQALKPDVARRTADHLRAKAPTLAREFAELLDPPPAGPKPVPRGAGWAGAGIFLLLLKLFLVAGKTSCSSSQPSRPVYTPYQTPARP